MSLELHQIESALRKQFVFLKDNRWSTDPVFNLGSKGLGMTVFTGVSWAYGWQIEDVAEYLGLTLKEAEGRLKDFKRRMSDGVERKQAGTLKDKDDITRLMYTKTWLTVKSIRHHFLNQDKLRACQLNW